MDNKSSPRAPQGPSDSELNAVPPDPVLLPYGGSTSQFADMVCSYSDLVTGPLMNPDRASSVAIVRRKG